MNPRQRSETQAIPLHAVQLHASGVDESSSEVGNLMSVPIVCSEVLVRSR